MDDNGPVYRAHTVDNYKDQNEVTSMEWPAQSPDLNIIENIWLYIKRELQKSMVNIAAKNDLLRGIQRVWRNIGLDYIRNLYQSIPDCLDNVVSLNIKVTLKLDLPNTVLKLSHVKCKQTPPYWKWWILMSLDCMCLSSLCLSYKIFNTRKLSGKWPQSLAYL